MAMFLNFPITEIPSEMAYVNCFSNNNEKNDVNVMVSNTAVAKEQRNKNTILNSTSSPSSSPKSLDSFQDDDNNNNNNSKVTIPHVHPSNYLSLCDNALFSLPKTEGMPISSSHLGTDTFSCLSPNELIDQWLKSTDGQELFA